MDSSFSQFLFLRSFICCKFFQRDSLLPYLTVSPHCTTCFKNFVWKNQVFFFIARNCYQVLHLSTISLHFKVPPPPPPPPCLIRWKARPLHSAVLSPVKETPQTYKWAPKVRTRNFRLQARWSDIFCQVHEFNQSALYWWSREMIEKSSRSSQNFGRSQSVPSNGDQSQVHFLWKICVQGSWGSPNFLLMWSYKSSSSVWMSPHPRSINESPALCNE